MAQRARRTWELWATSHGPGLVQAAKPVLTGQPGRAGVATAQAIRRVVLRIDAVGATAGPQGHAAVNLKHTRRRSRIARGRRTESTGTYPTCWTFTVQHARRTELGVFGALWGAPGVVATRADGADDTARSAGRARVPIRRKEVDTFPSAADPEASPVAGARVTVDAAGSHRTALVVQAGLPLRT